MTKLVLGKIEPASKAEYLRIIAALAQAGRGDHPGLHRDRAAGFPSRLQPVPVDTTRIHALAAVENALQG